MRVFEIAVNGEVVGQGGLDATLDAVVAAMAVGDVVALRLVEADAPAGASRRLLALKKRSRAGDSSQPRYAPLNVPQILRWADAHSRRTGTWPTGKDRVAIPGSPGLNWDRVDAALRLGLRGLKGGSSLARLLAAERGVRNRKALPSLTESQILLWADAVHERTGRWPTNTSGAVAEAPGETWCAVALSHGQRGLPGGTSLRKLLAACRGVRNPNSLPRLTESLVLEWADAHHAATGTWPTAQSGLVLVAADERWSALDRALINGRRGLAGGSSVAKLLEVHRGVRNRMHLPHLSEEQILEWAEAHHKRTGRWPTMYQGAIADALDERWSAVDAALRDGKRGLPGGSSLSRLLAARRTRV